MNKMDEKKSGKCCNDEAQKGSKSSSCEKPGKK